MSCLDTRTTFPAHLAYCGVKKAACCDGHCSALQGQMQRAALADAPYCVCCFSQTQQLFHTNAIAVSRQNESRFGTIGFGNDNCGKVEKENWGDTAKGIFCALYSKRNMAASASECTCSHMMEKRRRAGTNGPPALQFSVNLLTLGHYCFLCSSVGSMSRMESAQAARSDTNVQVHPA